MNLSGEEIRKYPEFHSELWRLCQQCLGPNDELDGIDLLTYDANCEAGFNIRYHFNGNLLHWLIINRYVDTNYKLLIEELKVIIRDNKLEKLGI